MAIERKAEEQRAGVTERHLPTRMGDGSMTCMTRSELRADIEEATALAARKAKVEPLAADEIDHVLDIYASAASFTAVDIGDQVVLELRRRRLQDDRHRHPRPAGERAAPRAGHPRALAHRVLLQGDQDDPAVPAAGDAERAADAHGADPVRRSAQPRLLLAAGRAGGELVRAAAAGQDRRRPAAIEEAMDYATKDFIYVGEGMLDAGADGMDFDTTGGAGDADFRSTLRRRRAPAARSTRTPASRSAWRASS